MFFCFYLIMKILFILILFLILKLYSFVNHSSIFRITTKERKNMVDSGFVNYGVSGLRIPVIHPHDTAMSYRHWLFPGCVYLIDYHRDLYRRYRPWLFPGCVYLFCIPIRRYLSYRPWSFPNGVYLKLENQSL